MNNSAKIVTTRNTDVRRLSQSPAWQALSLHQTAMKETRIRDLFAGDPGRARTFSVDVGALHLDYSKQRVNAETMQLLAALAVQADLPGKIAAMYSGANVNYTENRPALHTALRANAADTPHYEEICEARQRMYGIADRLRNRPSARADGSHQLRGANIDIVNLGIGGSDLGPRLAATALRPYVSPNVKLHFVANADPADLDETLQAVDPDSAIFIVTSKSFSTVETLANAGRARAWLTAQLPSEEAVSERFIAVTANAEAALAWGIRPDLTLPMWDWVGGRYSLWSSAGLAIAIAIGTDRFDEMLSGARLMDEHFRSATGTDNMPYIMAALSVWNSTFNGAETLAILPYCHQLRNLPAFLQQLQMESNGKRVGSTGAVVDYATSPIVWGAAGTVGQHSFHQLLHQGTHCVPCEFIVAVNGNGDADAQRMLVANAFAQAATLMDGAQPIDPHQVHPGNQPSSTILMDRLTPSSLGQLLALYEHKVFAESVLLDINPFDQWGVELGKAVAKSIQDGTRSIDLDGSTEDLIRRAEEMRRNSV